MNNSDRKQNLMDRILNKEGDASFYTFTNSDGKIWLMPARNMQIAMNLYQPSGVKGKLLKNFFPYLHRIGIVRKVVRAEKAFYQLHEELQRVLCEVFQTKNLEFSVFCGTPCVHQKITIQLSKEKRILGYCKVSDKAEIARLFEKEADILLRLEKQGMINIPQYLYYGEADSGVSVFVQSTAKTQKSVVLHEWGEVHEAFSNKLQHCTLQEIPFEESDYYKTLQNLQLHIDWLPEFFNQKLVRRTIEHVIDQYKGKRVAYSAYHADFTPWNMFVENGKLFVFDWEYAQLTYPSKLDRYHFFTQTANFEKHWTAVEIIEYVNSERGKWINREMYILYLLEIMSRFTMREKGNITEDMAKSFRIWMDLLNYLSK